MRLFNRRRGAMEFDDPCDVGMTSFKPTEDNTASPVVLGSEPQQLLSEEHRTLFDASTETLQLLKRAQQQEIRRITNDTWKKVSRPWDSMKRSESIEHLSNKTVIANRRKTFNFPQENEDKCDVYSLNSKQSKQFPAPAIPPQVNEMQQPTPSKDSNGFAPMPAKRKLGRVESLRLLLSKSNRIYRNKLPNSTKQDKGTDTQDIGIYEQIESRPFDSNKYSSISSTKSERPSSRPLSSHVLLRNRLQVPKTASCENLSILNGNQVRPLPGNRDMSTSTSIQFPETSSLSTLTVSNNSKRSSFPYAYIRSRLTSLQEETKPSSSPVKPPRPSIIQKQDSVTNKETSSILSANFNHPGFYRGIYRSMGNLVTSTEKDEMHISSVDGELEEDAGGVIRSFDPLKQIRIDLLHRNPSEIDEQSPSPTLWGRRSYSIGDMMLKKRKVGKSDSYGTTGGGIEESSGYDSDSTRNGHESPRNSKSSSSETEVDECSVKEGQTINRKLVTESLDSQSHSNNSECGSASSFPADTIPTGGCLITINSTPTSRAPSVNGFRRGEDGSIISVTTEIDQSEEDIDFYSQTIDGDLETSATGNITTNQKSTISFGGKAAFLKPNKETTTVSINKIEMNATQQSGKTAPSLRLRNRVRDKDREWNCVKPSRSKSLCLSIFTVTYTKGPRRKSLGFSVIGGKDSPVPGIFVKRIFAYGQASEDGAITEGDEILSINGTPLANCTHAETLNIFKRIKSGDVVLEIARREFLAPDNSCQNLKRQYLTLNSKSCEQLHQAY